MLFGVPEENEKGRIVVKSCAKMRLCVGNTYFEHTNLLKYTRVVRGHDGVMVKSMIDLVLVKNDMLRFVQIVTVVR